MSNVQKDASNNIGIDIGTIVIGSREAVRGACWQFNVSSQFPVTNARQENGAATVAVGPPHEGYSVETVLKNGEANGESRILNKRKIEVASLTFVNGVASGPCKLYDDRGKLFFEGCFVNGCREGEGKEFYPNGHVSFEGFFEQGQREGRGKEFDKYGNVSFDGFFKEGRKLNIVPLKEMKGYWREMNDKNEVVSICQKNDKCENDGICYFYSNGEISRISEWKDGKEVSDSGYCRIYDAPHKVFFEGRFVNGLKEGKAREVDGNGTVTFEGFFNKGKKMNIVPLKEMEGYWKEVNDENEIISICQRNDNGGNEGICYFYSNGTITRISEWKDGKEVSDSGYCRIYDAPHKVFFEGRFVNGLKEGKAREVDGNGTVTFEGFFNKGKKLNIVPLKEMEGYWKEMNDKNEVISICKKNDRCENEGFCYFFSNGIIERVSEWKNGVEVGVLKRFEGKKMLEYENGVKKYEGEYRDSVVDGYPREGKGEEYGKDGETLLYEGSYLNGKREGDGIEYRNGRIVYEGNWSNGKRNGDGKEYENGSIIYEGNWSNGKRNGDGKEYENGSIIYEGYWCDGVKFSESINPTIRKSANLNMISGNVNDVVISSNCCNHFTSLDLNRYRRLQSIDIGNECFKNVVIFRIDGLNHLKSIKIGMSSFTKKKSACENKPSRSFHILNCDKLESIDIGRYSFSDYSGEFELKNLPSLSSIIIGDIHYVSLNFYYSSFVVKDLPNLQSIQLGNGAFADSLSTVISNLPNLKSIQLDYAALWGRDDNSCSLEMKDLPKLEEITSDARSFHGPRSVTLSNIPNLKTVKLPGSFEYVKTKSISNDVSPLLKNVGGLPDVFSKGCSCTSL